MDQIALEIVHYLADLQYELDYDSGQRWPTMLSCQKHHILVFRSVCRAFRDASWIPFRDLLAERIFYLNEEDLTVLSEIAGHRRLGPLITALTFGSQVFTQSGLRILEAGLGNHPTHLELHAGPGAWQRNLSYGRTSLPYDELVQFKDLYETGLARQELLWNSGGASAILSDCIYRLSQHKLRSIRICPRPCHVTFEVKGKARLSFSSRSRTNYFVPHGAVNHTRCNAWRNIDRTLTAIAGLNARYVCVIAYKFLNYTSNCVSPVACHLQPLHDEGSAAHAIDSSLRLDQLQTSSLSNIRWSMKSSIFLNVALFSSLHTIQLSIREESLFAHGLYTSPDSRTAAQQFIRCLVAARQLVHLDLELCSMGEETFASYVLARLAEHEVPYQLQHLTLEYNVQSQAVLSGLILPHARTLKRLLLLNTWITSDGSWTGWLQAMRDGGLKVDYLEIWKPTQGGNVVRKENVRKIFRLQDLSAVAENGRVVTCLPGEQWDNCYPRFSRR